MSCCFMTMVMQDGLAVCSVHTPGWLCQGVFRDPRWAHEPLTDLYLSNMQIQSIMDQQLSSGFYRR